MPIKTLARKEYRGCKNENAVMDVCAYLQKRNKVRNEKIKYNMVKVGLLKSHGRPEGPGSQWGF